MNILIEKNVLTPMRDGVLLATDLYRNDDFWRSIDARNFAQIDKPVLHIGGWYDIFLNGSLQGYIGMRRGAESAEARNRQKLVVGPWSHGTNWTSSYHEMDYGMHASGEAVNLTGYPLNPVPSIGGANLMPFASSIGPRDQQQVETREDVLIFSTPVLPQNIEVTGPITAHLYVSSSAPDTDITCKLVDVHPDGRAILLTDGILRLRYRYSFTAPTLLQPDEIVPIAIDLWSTSNVFLAGHRLRIEVSSSCFPKFARNSNTGGNVATESREEYQVAVNRVYHDADHPSHILLPIIERA